MRIVQATVILIAGLGAAGCGGRTQGVLVPSALALPAGTAVVEMLVATTRSDINSTPGEMFGGERSNFSNYADIAVSIPPDSVRAVGDIQWPSKLPADPAKEFSTIRAERIDVKEALGRFHGRIAKTPHRSVLVFVHGFNTRFEDAVYRLAQIVHDSKAPTLPVLFTWPSKGSVLGYAYDRESTNYSRDALENLLRFLSKDPAVGEITLLAHSMGNWVALEALRQMSIRDGRIVPKLKHVMLAAPDVDVDVFRKQIAEIGDNRPPFTLMVSQDDRALSISRQVWGSTARLGAVDPKIEPYKTQFERDKLVVIDLTDQKTSDSLRHGKFAASPVVVRMIGQQIAGQDLHDSRTNLGESLGLAASNVAGVVGRASSIAISAPIAIVDHGTRNGLKDQFDDLGEKLKAPVSR